MHTNPTLINPTINVALKPPLGYVRPVLFGISSCTSIFFIAAYVHDKEEESIWRKFKERTTTDLHRLRDVITDESLLKHDIWKEKMRLWIQRKSELMQRLRHHLDQYQALPTHIKKSILGSAQLLLDVTEEEKVLLGITAIHLLVFGVWRIPRYQKFMQQYFVHSGDRTITLLTSVFSQRRLWHMSVNMAALWLVGPWLYNKLGREQFIATYLSLGISANVVSHVTRVAMARRWRHNVEAAKLATLGTDSALYGLLAGTTIIYPEATLIIPFLPTALSTLNLSYTLPAFLSMDAVALFFRWNRMDHIAHIGGTMMGIVYAKFGPDHLWPQALKTVRDVKASIHGRGSGNDKNGGGRPPGALMLILPEKLRLKLQKKATPAAPEGGGET
ncbi:hypothetical protein BDF20DRAFT_911814 [Mycotypha africana]|uniref:uncharacterized protein n=1 Tax=Mycotypha africana TaxID=64632 RepID=UPI00230132FC|nr:uncharacterized protein BDF20DRAFT_911814 [Mycotypha africana]KAI8984747.1 hypothetical protein BDF20DRAFT_911814 [Mycotypha africana]